ncbi:hypothetical protein [Radiobacillus deserti]|uniref:Uncharacterized protein n=1 Tax=Radiobacillus deserti TaxID=2594883 RepID=A0A516KIY7_9BACI|nr:hypothetical protein [Radiobacillus deserti]QDP41341.1 hypothetical protein FN924_14805 [Radiobacillus deserti]
MHGFHSWDTTAAVYLTHPELFEDYHCIIDGAEEDLKSGSLKPDQNKRIESPKVNIPIRIRDVFQYNTTILEAWSTVSLGHFAQN